VATLDEEIMKQFSFKLTTRRGDSDEARNTGLRLASMAEFVPHRIRH
jgi:hypothetical protein